MVVRIQSNICTYKDIFLEKCLFCYGRTISAWRKSLKLVDGNVDKAVKTSLKEKLEAYKAQVAGVGSAGIDKTKGKDAAI